MREKSPLFLLFLGTISGSLLSYMLPRWSGLLLMLGAIGFLFLKDKILEFFAVFLCGMVLFISPFPFPAGKYFIVGRVSSHSKRTVKLSHVKFRNGRKWIRGRDIYVFLGGFVKDAKVVDHGIFVAQIEHQASKCVALKYFSFSLDSPIERLYAFGARVSNFLYMNFEKYVSSGYQTIAALFLGRDSLSYTSKKLYKDGGYAHVFSVSGMHVGMLALFGLFFFSEFLPWNSVKYVAVFLLVVLYGFVTGFSIPTFRAISMFGVFSLFKILDRPQSLLNVLSFVGSVEILFDPSLIFDVSFQLSYSAMLAIAMLFERFPRFKPHWLADSLWLTVSANIGVMPFLILHFSRIYVASFIFNSTIVPLLVFILMEGALVFSFFAFIGFHFGESILGNGINVFSRLLDRVAYLTDKIPLSVLRIQSTGVLFWITFLCVASLFLWIYFFEPFGIPDKVRRSSAGDP